MCVCVQTWQSRGFAKDTWLEAVNPHQPVEVCVAQITQVRGRLLWLRLEGTDVCVVSIKCQRTPAVFHSETQMLCECVCACDSSLTLPLSAVYLSPGVPKPLSECIVDVESMDIFPVGWCEANAYPLTPPLKPVCMYTRKETHTFIFRGMTA